jgi:site-specific DNA recombinase
VQARLTATRQSPGVAKAIRSAFWKQRRPRHLLTGLAQCGVCGKPFAAVGRDYLACGAARRQGTCDNRRAIRREILESVILDALRSRLMQPDLVAEFAEAYQQEVNRQRAGADAARE